jgi:hypothetical protein
MAFLWWNWPWLILTLLFISLFVVALRRLDAVPCPLVRMRRAKNHNKAISVDTRRRAVSYLARQSQSESETFDQLSP